MDKDVVSELLTPVRIDMPQEVKQETLHITTWSHIVAKR
jgi:hypothetical protein